MHRSRAATWLLTVSSIFLRSKSMSSWQTDSRALSSFRIWGWGAAEGARDRVRGLGVPAMSSVQETPQRGVQGSRAAGVQNAARRVRGQVATHGHPAPQVPTSLGTQPPRYLPPQVPTLWGWVPRQTWWCLCQNNFTCRRSPRLWQPPSPHPKTVPDNGGVCVCEGGEGGSCEPRSTT